MALETPGVAHHTPRVTICIVVPEREITEVSPELKLKRTPDARNPPPLFVIHTWQARRSTRIPAT